MMQRRFVLSFVHVTRKIWIVFSSRHKHLDLILVMLWRFGLTVGCSAVMIWIVFQLGYREDLGRLPVMTVKILIVFCL
jgi:hypothetical protein